MLHNSYNTHTSSSSHTLNHGVHTSSRTSSALIRDNRAKGRCSISLGTDLKHPAADDAACTFRPGTLGIRSERSPDALWLVTLALDWLEGSPHRGTNGRTPDPHRAADKDHDTCISMLMYHIRHDDAVAPELLGA